MRRGRAHGIRATRLWRASGLAAIGLLAVIQLVSAGPTPPPGLNASASYVPVPQYVNDATGVDYIFTIHNTGSESIGAVEIKRPSSAWTVKACTSAPLGWTSKRSGKSCKYQSAAGTADNIAPGASSNAFELRAGTAAGGADAVGTWVITVSTSSKFDGQSRFRPAAPEGTGLAARAYSFQIMDGAVADVPVGQPCPAATPANHSATVGTTATIVICGRNRTSGAATTTSAGSSLAGALVGGIAAGFQGGSVPANSGNVVLGRWTSVPITSFPGSNLDLLAVIAAGPTRTSPLTHLDDGCFAPGTGEDCVDNGAYEATSGGGNTPPTAVDDGGAGFATDEDTSFTTGSVLTNDTDPDLDALSVQSMDTTGTKGLVTNNSDGTFGYDPNGQFEGLNNGDSDTDTFTYTVSDGNGGTDTATVTITITGVTDGGGDAAPSVISTTPADGATDVAVGTSIDVTFSESVAASGSSFTLECPDNTPIAFAATGSPGTTITVDPDADLPAGTTCVVTVLAAGIADSDADDPPDNLTADVVFSFTTASPGDTPPTAVDDSATVGEDSGASAIDVLANDPNADGGPKNIASASDPANGTVVLTGGSPGAHTGLTYAPDPQFCNDPPGTLTDDFTYTLNGGSTATVSVTVTCVDDAPTALDDTATVAEDSAPNAISVLANDVDVDGGPMTIASASDPANGTVVLTGGSPGAHTGLTYQPDASYCNDGSPTDDFTYTLNGGDSATVAVTVTCAGNTPPDAVDDSATVAEDALATAIDVLANDVDNDGGPKNITLASDPANGTVVLTGGSPGAHTGLTYAPDPNYCNDPPGVNPDTFTYTVNGGDTASVSVTVTCVNDNPVITTTAGSASFTENGGPVTVDGSLTVTDVDGPNLVGATVSIAGGQAGDTLAFTPAFGISDTDASPTVLALSGSATASDYQTVLRSVTFDSTSENPGSGTRTVSFVVSDGSIDSNTATRDVTVAPVNDAPVVTTSAGSTAWTEDDPPTTIDAGLTVTDPDDTTLESATVSVTSGFQTSDELSFVNQNGITGVYTTGTGILALTGSASVANYQLALRSVAYRHTGDAPAPNKTITFAVNDGTDSSVGATKAITTTNLKDNPIASDDSGVGFTTDEDSSFTTGSVLANDIDGDFDAIAVQSMDTTGTKGLVTNNADGTFAYDPNAQFEALNAGETDTDTFTYTVSDGNGGTDVATVTITINGKAEGGNTPPVAVDDGGAGFGTDENTSFTTGNALGNDTDADLDTLTVESIDITGTAGLVTDNGNGTFGYDPNGQFESLDTGDSDTDTFTYTVSDGNGGTDTATVTITITGSNDSPTGIDLSPSSVDEGEPIGTVVGTLTATDADAGDTWTFSLVSGTGDTDNGAFQIDGTALETNAVFDFETDDEFSIRVQADDGDGTFQMSLIVTILDVAEGPTAVDDGGASFTTTEAQSFITGNVLDNDTDPDGDTLTVLSFDDTGTLGSVTDNGNGTFTYDPAGAFEALGATDSDVDTFEYTVTDGNGGTDTAVVTITINGANDIPDAVDDSDSTDEDTAKTIDPRTNDTDADSSDVLTIIAVGVTTNGGSASIQNAGSQVRFDPGADFQDLGTGQSRQSSFTYTISDGNGGQDTATVTFTVTGINDNPVADDESFSGADSAIGNTVLLVNDPTDGAPTVAGPNKAIAGDILAGDTDAEGAALAVSAGTFATNDGGSVTLEADGDFTFQPAAGTSCTDLSDFFDYTVSDGTLTDVGRVTIAIANCVWYVNNNATGNSGTSSAPFDTLAQADTAATTTGATIYVFRGDGTSTGLTTTQVGLLANQRLVGEAQALVVGGVTLQAAGLRPSIAAGVQMSGGCTVTGVSLTANAVAGIVSGGGNNSGTIDDVIISSNFGGIQLSGTTGTWNLSNLTVSSSLLDAIQLSSAGTVNFLSTGTISVTATGGRGIAFSGTTALSGTIDSITASGTATTGIFLDDTTGSLTIDDVNLATTGVAIDIDSANGITINNTGDGDVTSSNIAVRATTVTSNPADMPDIALDQVSSTGGVAGIVLTDIGNGTFSAVGGSLSGHTTAEIDIDGGSGAVTYPGTIGNGTGLSLDITNRTGGTLTLAGTITDTNDAGGGINLDNNDGSVVTLSGNLTLNTGTAAGFVATAGGTVNVTGSANTVTTTTGTGVNITGTTIGASHVTFDTVNVSGNDTLPTNGIVVSGTGASGHFEVTGTGSAGTGGTIQNTAGDGVLLVGTLAPSLSSMTITSNLGNGIHGGDGTAGGVVTGATLASLTVSSNGDNTGAEDGILFQGLVGSPTFSGLNVSGSARHNVAVINNSGTLTSLTISGSQIHDNNIVAGSNGIELFADLTATMTVSIGSTSFTENRVTGVHAATSGSGTLTVSINGLGAAVGDPVTFTNNFVSVDFAHGSTGSLTGTLQNAKITNGTNACSTAAGLPCGAPVNVFLGNGAGSAAGSILRATVNNNVINNGGSGNAPGIWFHTGTPVRGHARLLLTNNQISNVDERGIAVEGGGCNTVNVPGATCDATVDSTITGNTISLTTAAASDAIHFNVGTAGTLAGNNDTMDYCAEISSNSLDTDAGGFAVRLRQRSLTTILLPGYVGSPTDTAAVQSFLNGKNTEPDADPYSAAVQAGGGGFQNTTGGTPCLTP